MTSLLVRRLLGVALVGVLLSPAAWMRETCADDWADETSPSDDRATPGPDLYANRRFSEGVDPMPDVAQSTAALDVLEILPTGRAPSFALAVRPGRLSCRKLFSGSPRAPPVPSPA